MDIALDRTLKYERTIYLDQKNFEVKLLFKTVIKLSRQLHMKSVVSTINKPRITKSCLNLIL